MKKAKGVMEVFEIKKKTKNPSLTASLRILLHVEKSRGRER